MASWCAGDGCCCGGSVVVYGCGEEGERWSVGGLAMHFGFVGGELGCVVRCKRLWKWKVEMNMS